jgi:cold shock CspA family protein
MKSRYIGKIIKINKNYGFIHNFEKNRDIFFHISAFKDTKPCLNMNVSYEVSISRVNQKIMADKIQQISSNPNHEILDINHEVLEKIYENLNVSFISFSQKIDHIEKFEKLINLSNLADFLSIDSNFQKIESFLDHLKEFIKKSKYPKKNEYIVSIKNTILSIIDHKSNISTDRFVFLINYIFQIFYEINQDCESDLIEKTELFDHYHSNLVHILEKMTIDQQNSLISLIDGRFLSIDSDISYQIKKIFFSTNLFLKNKLLVKSEALFSFFIKDIKYFRSPKQIQLSESIYEIIKTYWKDQAFNFALKKLENEIQIIKSHYPKLYRIYHTISYLKKYQIKYLYHMTHIDNVANIFQSKYLKSHELAHREKLIKEDISMQEAQNRRAHLHQDVPFYFNPRNTMLYKRKEKQSSIIMLAFDPLLFLEEGFRFTNQNGAAAYTSIYTKIEDLDQLSWSTIFSDSWNHSNPDVKEVKKKIMCAEFLIKNRVSTKHLQKIFLYSNLHFDRLNAMIEIEKSNNQDFSVELEIDQAKSLYF